MEEILHRFINSLKMTSHLLFLGREPSYISIVVFITLPRHFLLYFCILIIVISLYLLYEIKYNKIK